jgi:hypothetical protein
MILRKHFAKRKKKDIMLKTIGNTSYSFSDPKRKGLSFPPRKSGKKPELSTPTFLKRMKKPITVRVFRYWQDKAFNKLFNSMFFLVKAFCGSGKTTLSVALALYDVIKNRRKQIFIVPQSHIGDGFSISGKFYVPGLGIVNLCSATNYCENSPSKVQMLADFMTRPASFSNFDLDEELRVDGTEGMVVCTHAAFNAAMKKVIADGNFDLACKDTAFYIDEAHHVKGGETKEDDEEFEDYNQLGKVLYKIIASAESNNSRVGLTTATFFRGDQGIIVSSDYLAKFDRYELDFLSHFETLGIEKVFINFEEYEDDPINQIVENIRKEIHTERHLLVVPTIVGKWRKHKDPNLEILLAKIREMLVEEGLNPDEAILDLVPENTQDKNKAILLKEPKERYDEENNSKIRIVITCMLGREGTDWCPCSRLHNASIELGSPTLAVQTLGRLFRAFEGKDTVGITYYIKKFNNLKNVSSKREFLMDRINAMLTLMIIDDLLNPIILPEIPNPANKSSRSTNSSKNKSSVAIRLSDVFGDNFESVKRKILDSISMQSNFDEKTVNRIINSVIAEYGLDKVVQVQTEDGIKETDIDSVAAGLKLFLLRARSEILRSKSIDISVIRERGFDKLVQETGSNGNFWCGVFDMETLIEFRELIGKTFWNREENNQIKSNLLEILSKNIGSEIDAKNKSHERIIRKNLLDFVKFHGAYNEISQSTGLVVPSKKDVAERLRISTTELDKKVDHFNKIVPKGFEFFEEGSKLSNKVAIDHAA